MEWPKYLWFIVGFFFFWGDIIVLSRHVDIGEIKLINVITGIPLGSTSCEFFRHENPWGLGNVVRKTCFWVIIISITNHVHRISRRNQCLQVPKQQIRFNITTNFEEKKFGFLIKLLKIIFMKIMVLVVK